MKPLNSTRKLFAFGKQKRITRARGIAGKKAADRRAYGELIITCE